MVSPVYFILDLISKIKILRPITNFLNFSRSDDIVVVRRFPPRKVLRAHILGLTFGLLLALSIICFNYTSLFAELPWYTPTIIGFLFVVGTIAGGPFVILVVLFLLTSLVVIPVTGDLIKALGSIAQWYFGGYAFGFIFATLYNDLVFLYLLTFCKDRVKIAFAFDFAKKINIIKSPRPGEEKVFERLLRGKSTKAEKELKKRKLYNYDLDYPTKKKPYTIVFVANPKILKENKNNEDPIEFKRDESNYDPDPIMKNSELFLRSIDRALYSFERDEVLGRHEIWSQVRIVAIFDKNLKVRTDSGLRYGLVQPYHNHPMINGVVAENLLDPMEHMLEEILINVDDETQAILNELIGTPDVIFALSASEKFTRSTAHFSDWKESTGTVANNEPGDKEFKSDPDPIGHAGGDNGKGDEIEIVEHLETNGFKSRHDKNAVFPGRVALNVLKASTKTYIHEFAHAMSSAYNGAIVDEYFDKIQGSDSGTTTRIEPLVINRIERQKPKRGKVNPVHKIFAEYDHLIYKSDRNHPSAREDWLGYFPERQALYTRCTMDRGFTDYCWDKLIHHFMYDRLIAKINR
jgi:hypothetical protein